MKHLFLFLAPIVLGLATFFGFVYYLTVVQTGNGALQVTAVPASKVYLNGRVIGQTPLCKCEGKDQIPSGTYAIKLVPLSGDNLSSYEDTVTITKGILTVVDRTFGVGEFSSGSVITLTPLSNPKTTELFITSVPTGASVTLDGNPSGTTPLLLSSITPSDHDVLLSEDGYESKTVHIRTVTGYKLSALVTLGIAPLDGTPSGQLVSPSPSLAPSVPQVVILSTPTGYLRVRVDPSLTASETAQVKPGQSFDYINEQSGWYEIKLSDGSSGWVSADYAQRK